MSTEQKILDYMDGTLNENESGELLHSLSVSPEKRVVLEQHIKLRELTSLAQKPYAVPQALEARMADRFAAIAEYNNEVSGGAAFIQQASRTSFISRIGASLASFISAYPLRTGFAVATAAVVVYFALPQSQQPQVAQQTGSVPAAQTPVIVGNGTVRTDVTNGSNPISVEIPKTFGHVVAKANHVRSNSSLGESFANTTATRSQQHQPEHIVNENGNDIPTAHNAVPPTVSNRNDVAENTTPAPVVAHKETDVPKETPKVIETPKPIAQNAVTPNSAQTSDANVGSHVQNPLKHREENPSSFPFAIRLSYGYGSAFVNAHQSDNVLASHMEGTPIGGFDYIISPNLSVGAEIGSAAIAELITTSTVQPGTTSIGNLPSISRVVTTNSVATNSQTFVRAMARWTMNPFDAIRFEGSIGGGASFASQIDPLLSASLFGVYDLSRNIGLIVGASLSGTWASTSPTTNSASVSVSDPVGYVTVNQASRMLFTPSYALRVGVKFKAW
ncbi:MAG: hypothetical protein WCH46_09010 [bacterium]